MTFWDWAFGVAFIANIPLFFYLGRLSRNAELAEAHRVAALWHDTTRNIEWAAEGAVRSQMKEIERLVKERAELLARCGETP